MRRPVNFLPSFYIGTFRAIEDKYRQERRVHECRAAKEQRSEDRVLPFASIFRVEEPYTGIDSEAESAFPVRVCFKSFLNCNVGQRAVLGGRLEDLSARSKFSEYRNWSVTYIPQASYSHNEMYKIDSRPRTPQRRKLEETKKEKEAIPFVQLERDHVIIALVN